MEGKYLYDRVTPYSSCGDDSLCRCCTLLEGELVERWPKVAAACGFSEVHRSFVHVSHAMVGLVQTYLLTKPSLSSVLTELLIINEEYQYRARLRYLPVNWQLTEEIVKGPLHPLQVQRNALLAALEETKKKVEG